MRSGKDLSKLAAALGGLPVIGCRSGSPADRAGVAYGDIVLSINGMPTPDWSAFIEARSLSKTSMTIELFRDGERLVFEIVLDQHASLDPAQVLSELISERLMPLPPADPDDPSTRN